MSDYESKSIIRKHDFASKSKMRCCFLPNCDNKAIASHLLQKNGILNKIAINNHLYQVGIDIFSSDLFRFEKIGINNAFTFPGFCDLHDTTMFKEIETNRINFNDYRTNLLFSFRILADEMRKKEILIDRSTSNINNERLRQLKDFSFFIEQHQLIVGYKQALNDGEYFLNKFYADINSNSTSFSFLTIEMPYVEICASAVFTYETTAEVAAIPEWLQDKPLTDIYFNLLPFENHSIAIIGCLTEMKENCWDFITAFDNTDKSISLKKISDLLLSNVENWLCSESVYHQLKKCESTMIKILHESIIEVNERRTLSFNMFDYLTVEKVNDNVLAP